MSSERGLCGFRNERWCAGQQLICNDAECVDVRAVIDQRVCESLLRRHVCRRTDGHATAGQLRSAFGGRGCAQGFRYTEVGDKRKLAGEQDIVRLDVAMNHTLPVRIRKRRSDVPKRSERIAERKWTIASDLRPE